MGTGRPKALLLRQDLCRLEGGCVGNIPLLTPNAALGFASVLF